MYDVREAATTVVVVVVVVGVVVVNDVGKACGVCSVVILVCTSYQVHPASARMMTAKNETTTEQPLATVCCRRSLSSS